MLDPVTTPLLLLVLGKLGEELLTDACKDFLKDRLGSLFGWLGKAGRRGDLELAYQAALQDALTVCLEMLLTNITACGYSKEELQPFADSLKTLARDEVVCDELLEALKDPLDPGRPAAETLAQRWSELGCLELPGDLWTGVALAFRRRAAKRAFINEPMREVLNAQNLDRVRELLERAGGVRPEVRQDKYALRMRTKYAPVDLANLMPAYAGDPGQLVIRDVFVPQRVKENPPAVELPKDFERRLREKGIRDLDELSDDEQRELAAKHRERLTTAYVNQSPRPVLDVIAEEANRLLMLVGEPGSGKSTLLRYVLLGVLEPPCDAQSGLPLPWTIRFSERRTFPLLIELRDFHATRVHNDDVDSFLDYARYLGQTEQYFLDDQWLDRTLRDGPSLVMFDGLDEIFDRADREKVMHEIAGFVQRYPRARIVVTSRPVGYRDAILRQAGFRHFALQDLDTSQIEAFTRGWFGLTFPQQPQLAAQRIERVLSSVRRSKPILLLAGNPMLLTIMALLAREQELPRERAAFYEAAVNVLCHHWDANRNLTLPQTDYLRLEDKKELLRRVAMRMQTGNVGQAPGTSSNRPGSLAANAIHETDLEAEVAAWFGERFKQSEFEAIKSARLMIQQLRERNYILCLRGPRLYGFVHRTFLEFLTAAEYVARFKDERTLTEEELLALYDAHCRDEDWREVLRLIAGQINEQVVGQIVERLATRTSLETWDGKTPLPELPLAILCLSEVRNLGRIEQAAVVLLSRVVGIFLLGKRPEKDFIEGIVTAAGEIGERWPGRSCVEFPITLPSGPYYHHRNWPEFVAVVTGDRRKVTECADGEQWDIRRGACEALAKHWPDESTRELLRARAVEDKDGGPRSAALQALASTWPDDSTRELLRARAVEDTDGYVRSAALQALASTWPDESTRGLLRARAVEDKDDYVRSAALQALASTWPDESTRGLLLARAVQDNDWGPRIAALQALASTWPEESTRELLLARVVQDEQQYVRSAALEALASTWPDEST
ncbi:MAG: HEAT repeat domain-containing protein, partial [Planctomycetia bacterium]|nr:HEAT repeat domain-containing protein [Planctomycetia bacterium]